MVALGRDREDAAVREFRDPWWRAERDTPHRGIGLTLDPNRSPLALVLLHTSSTVQDRCHASTARAAKRILIRRAASIEQEIQLGDAAMNLRWLEIAHRLG